MLLKGAAGAGKAAAATASRPWRAGAGSRWHHAPASGAARILLPPLGGRGHPHAMLRHAGTTAAAGGPDGSGAHSQFGVPGAPDSPYCILNFYHLVDVARPHAVVAAHKAWLADRELRGRIYVSEQGVNAQCGGRTDDAVAYVTWLAETQPLFRGLRYSLWPAQDHQFPKLRLKYRPNLISLAGGMSALPVTRPEARATPLQPADWRRMLAEAQSLERPPVVLDVRNSYEWDAGHFSGAARPAEAEFNETPTEATPAEVPAHLQAVHPDTPVMMYCTGGIRCDVYSTYLKLKGYKNLYTLEGGIQNYLASEGVEHWDGSLFVFDGRMAIRPDRSLESKELPAAVPCQVCEATAVLPHLNCANIDCNKLFLACTACKDSLKGCCCAGCMDAPRLLRPVKASGTYGTWRQYADSDGDEAAMTAGRDSESRISRRRRRQAAMKDRGLAKRAEKMERRQVIKAVMEQVAAANLSGGSPSGSTSGSASSGGAERAAGLERMARLRELRERLASGGKAHVAAS